ncbi:pupal cuticle protein Edg-84A-like [Daktulosphaira vitifoliae]|uniref:pupal cuticle protein Edg-84A-like n=1 Tax=Daktulosphaira vitifoliae TaxID=58002 RepID=UPI0021AA6E0C|nr:pupal cuticle protein Edg-84A-like [Daktulosphaira vitifoliae]
MQCLSVVLVVTAFVCMTFADDLAKPTDYKFSYGVSNPASGDHKDQAEVKNGDFVTGFYRTLDADGLIRTVNYHVDPLHGFNADVVRAPASDVVPVVKSIISEPVIAKSVIPEHVISKTEDVPESIEIKPVDFELAKAAVLPKVIAPHSSYYPYYYFNGLPIQKAALKSWYDSYPYYSGLSFQRNWLNSWYGSYPYGYTTFAK